MNQKVALHNLGCKVNAYEMDAMQQLLEAAGYTIVPFEPGADIYVINTCTVTNIADRKSRQMLHRARKMNPQAIVVAVGCYVQADAPSLKEDPAIDLLIGNDRKQDIVRLLEAYQAGTVSGDSIACPDHEKTYAPLSVSRTERHARAYIKVQDGCNQFCSYCMIPYVRGRVRSRDLMDVIQEARRLVQEDCQEIVLTGIHLSSYGCDFSDHRENLLSLIERVVQVPGIRRLRLGSLEPGIITEDFVRKLASLEEVCPHFHLSLQSGCDATLRRMNRRYDSSMFREKCEILRSYYKDPALTTDVIVGFPGETWEEFYRSRDFVESLNFYETHIFKYSSRKGTKAAAMPDQIPEQIKSRRSEEMLSIHERQARKYEEKFLGRKVEVLLEERAQADGAAFYIGHSREYLKCAVPARQDLGPNVIAAGNAQGFLKSHILKVDL